MKNKLFPIQEVGSLRKPLWLLRTLRNRNITKEEGERVRDDAAYINIKMLEELGLDIVYDGEARRVEMYEYPIKNIAGFKFCGQVRSFDNRYYRKARCITRIEYKGPYHFDEALFVKRHSSKEIKIPVTGPYTLADWSYNEYYSTKEEFLFDLAKIVIRPLLLDLERAGIPQIQIDEPASTTHPGDIKIFVEAFNEAVSNISSKISVHICYSGNYESLFPHVLEMKTAQFILEFANRDTIALGLSKEKRIGYDALNLFNEYNDKREIGLGVVDVHTDDLEEPHLIRDRILYATKIIDDPYRIFVNPDCGLRTRSREIAFEKLRRLVQGAKLARNTQLNL